MCSMRLAEQGGGFVMELANSDRQAVRLEFPDWILCQLMRALPRIDAALKQRHGAASSDLLAYPVRRWNVEGVGPGMGIALYLCDDRDVDAAFHLSLQAAAELHRELGAVVARACNDSAERAGSASVN